MRVIFLAIAWAALAAPVWAQGALPSAVQARVATLEQMCRTAGGRPTGQNGVFANDYTFDGRTDYLVSDGNFGCSARNSPYITDGQAFVEVYVAGADGSATRVYRELLVAYRLLDTHPRIIIQIARRGAVCGRDARGGMCGHELAWNGHAFDVVAPGAAPRTGAVAQTTPQSGSPSAPQAQAGAGAAAPATPNPPLGTGPIAVAAYINACAQRAVEDDPSTREYARESCGYAEPEDRAESLILADEILAVAPAQPGLSYPPATVRGRLPTARWDARPRDRSVALSGRLDMFTVEMQTALPNTVTFTYSSQSFERNWNAPAMLMARGATVSIVGCEAFGVGESTAGYRVAAPGRQPFLLLVHQRSSPTASAWGDYTLTVDLSGRPTTTAGLRSLESGSQFLPRCNTDQYH